MTAQGHEELYCSSDDAEDDAGEAAGGDVVAAGGGVSAAGGSSAVFLRLRNIVIGSCERGIGRGVGYYSEWANGESSIQRELANQLALMPEMLSVYVHFFVF